jgi:hypothetical protein
MNDEDERDYDFLWCVGFSPHPEMIPFFCCIDTDTYQI